MTRAINPTPQFLDGNGDPLCFGKVFIYKSQSNDLLTTYADELETIANTNPVELDAAGRLPNVFYTGSARVVLKNCNNEQIWERDPVGGEGVLADFAEWESFIIYDLNDIVEYKGSFYLSKTNGNQGNDPSVSPSSNANWSQVSFTQLYNSTTTYAIGANVKASDGSQWRSVVSANLGNDPSSDDGTNWIPSIDGGKIAEVITLDTRTTTVIPQIGGGVIAALRVNELQDGGAYTLPLANTVSANQTIIITLPDEFKAFEPVVSRSGSDTISFSGGTDTSITFDSGSSISITLTSDGISDWRL